MLGHTNGPMLAFKFRFDLIHSFGDIAMLNFSHFRLKLPSRVVISVAHVQNQRQIRCVN